MLQDVRTVPNTAGFTIRGMGNIASSPSIDPTVGVFVDGMYMGITQGALVNTFDVETVEILRGPQGTLFGRNVTGGAVVVRHRRPTGQLDARGRTIVSNNNGALWVQQDAVVEAPFTDTIATKLGFMYRFDEGYFDNIERDSRTGGGTTYLIRPQLRFTPTPDFEVFVIGEYQDFDGDGPVFAIQKDSPPLFPNQIPDDEDEIRHDLDAFSKYEIGSVVVEANWRLGPGKLTSISGWRNYDSRTDLDVDGSGQFLFHSKIKTDQEQYSQELRYAADLTDAFNLTTGVYVFSQDLDYKENRRLFNDTLTSGGGGTQDHTAWAVFAQGGYALTNAINLTAGTRYTWEDKEVQVANFFTPPPNTCTANFNPCPFTFKDSHTWDFVSGHAGLDWHPQDTLLLYGKWDRSFRSGGYNIRTSGTGIPGPYDEEKVNAFEAGLKADWFDGRLRTNLAGFYNKYKGLQRQVLTPAPTGTVITIDNAADAHIVGGELELTALPLDTLELNGSVGYAKGTYDEFDNLPGFTPSQAEDLDFPQPEWTAFAGARYGIPWQPPFGGAFTVQATVSYTDARPNVTNTTEADSYTLFDAAVIYNPPIPGLTVSLFGRNLLDDTYTNGTIVFPFATTENGRAPGRRWGVEFMYNVTELVGPLFE